MKILVIDDDPNVKNSIEELPMEIDELQAIRSGDAAIRGVRIALKRQDPFELITVDIELPDMDGRQVVLEIRKMEREYATTKERSAVIVVLTAKADEKSVKTSLSAGANSFIVKPFRPETIIKTLAKSRLKSRISKEDPNSGKAVDPVEVILQRLKAGKIKMASLPDVSMKLNEMAKKGLDFKVMGDLIRKDPAITAKIMSVSNSAYYGAASKTRTIDEAISRIGIYATKQYVDAICNQQMFTSTDVRFVKFAEELWQHSLYCAVASQAVVSLLELDLKADAFSIGLLHDIGKMFLLQMTAELEKKKQLGGKVDLEKLFASVERYHNTIGAQTLKKWNFSREYVEGALFHDALEKKDSPSKELLVLHFANALSKTVSNRKEPSKTELSELESASLLKITPELIERIKNRVDEQLPLFS